MNKPPTESSAVTKEVMNEAGNALDSLARLSVELTCQGRGPPDTLVLSASRVMDACSTINQAVDSLKRILRIGEEIGKGPASPQASG